MSSQRKTQARKQSRQVARFIRSHRLRLELLALALIPIWMVIAMPIWIPIPIFLIAIGLVAWKRKFLFERTHAALYGAHVERQLKSAVRDAGFGEIGVEKVAQTLPGEWVDVRVPRGRTVSELDRVSEAVASCLRVSDVRVIADREDRSHAGLSIIRRNSFLGMSGVEWPLMNAETVDIRQGIPFGQDEYGRVANIRLLARNLMFGGAPDAGKSSALRIPAAAAALDPKAKLWMMDAKTGGAEFVHWSGAAHRLVRGRDLEAAIEMFAELEERVEARGREIVRRGEVFVCEDMELDVLMIDELPQYMRVREDDTKEQQKAVSTIRGAIWKLIALGRWAGMITILSAQKPTADIVPSESRDLIDHRFALHCNTRQMSDAILGDGAGGEVKTNAADIPSGQPGVGYYQGDHGVQKIRAFWMSHEQALGVAQRVGRSKLDRDLSTITS